MDICELNWGYIKDIAVALISAGIPSFVAWIIYMGWNKQKASEVIANEAKQFVSKLAILQSMQIQIYKTIYESQGYDDINSKMYEFIETKKIFFDSANLLGEAIKNKSISNKATSVMAQVLFFEKDIQEYMDGLREIKNVRMINPADAKHISDEYLQYALYKKTI